MFVCAARPGDPLTRFALDRDALAAGKALSARPDDPRAVLLAGCGTPAGQRVRVADPVTRARLSEGEVGEIWVQGPNVGRGYWNRESQDVFGARFADAAAGPGGWLRTGDLGTVLEGQLVVTGRLKDLIIVDGRNHYPQDVEATAQDADPAVRRDRLAAFAVPGGAGEGVVVVAEHARTARLAELDVAGRGACRARCRLRPARAAARRRDPGSAGHGAAYLQREGVAGADPGPVPGRRLRRAGRGDRGCRGMRPVDEGALQPAHRRAGGGLVRHVPRGRPDGPATGRPRHVVTGRGRPGR